MVETETPEAILKVPFEVGRLVQGALRHRLKYIAFQYDLELSIDETPGLLSASWFVRFSGSAVGILKAQRELEYLKEFE